MQFRYTVSTPTGQIVTGTTEAPSEEVAEEALWRAGYTIIRLEPAASRPRLDQIFPTLLGVKRRDRIAFTRQLATLLQAGVPLLPSLQLLAGQSDKAALAEALRQIGTAIQGGASLADAMAQHPDIFPSLYTRTVQVGERTGRLEIVLQQLVTHLAKEESVTSRLWAALVYPAFLFLLAGVVAFILTTVTLPPLLTLFAELQVSLPWTTRAVIVLAGFLGSHRGELALVSVGIVAVLWWYGRQPAGQYRYHHLALTLPLIGRINRATAIAHFARTMSLLLRAGLPLVEVMDLLLQATGNRVVRQALEQVRQELLTGAGLSRPLAANPLFPGLLVQMTRVGEETGTLENNLDIVATFYEEEADRTADALMNLLQPALIGLIGLLVAFLAVAVILPMYQILGSFGR